MVVRQVIIIEAVIREGTVRVFEPLLCLFVCSDNNSSLVMAWWSAASLLSANSNRLSANSSLLLSTSVSVRFRISSALNRCGGWGSRRESESGIAIAADPVEWIDPGRGYTRREEKRLWGKRQEAVIREIAARDKIRQVTSGVVGGL